MLTLSELAILGWIGVAVVFFLGMAVSMLYRIGAAVQTDYDDAGNIWVGVTIILTIVLATLVLTRM